MKTSLTLILSFLFGASFQIVYGAEISFLPLAESNFSGIESVKSNLKNQIDKFQSAKQAQAVSFQDNVARLQNRFNGVTVDPVEKRAHFNQNHLSTGVEYVKDDDFKNLAMDFMQKNIPLPLSQFEQFKVADVEYEKSVSEERDESGSIKKNVPIKTISAVVKIGRTAYGYPIFNSTVAVGFSALEKNVFYLDINNWNSINPAPREYQSKMNAAHIRETIKNRINNSSGTQDPSSGSGSIEIREAVFGWNMDQIGNLAPAILYHGAERDKNGVVTRNFCSLDTL